MLISKQCLDQQYSGAEVFQLTEFNEKQLENYQLQSEIGEWKESHSLIKTIMSRNKELKQRLEQYQNNKQQLFMDLEKEKAMLDSLKQKIKQNNSVQQNDMVFDNVTVQYYDDIALLNKKCEFKINKIQIDYQVLKEIENKEKNDVESGCENMGDSSYSVRIVGLVNSRTSRIQFRVKYHKGGVRVYLGNKEIMSEWKLMDSNELVSEEIVVYKGYQYELIVEYFGSDPFQSYMEISRQENDGQIEIVDNKIVNSEEQMECGWDKVEYVLDDQHSLQAMLSDHSKNQFVVMCHGEWMESKVGIQKHLNICDQLMKQGYLQKYGGVTRIQRYRDRDNNEKYKQLDNMDDQVINKIEDIQVKQVNSTGIKQIGIDGWKIFGINENLNTSVNDYQEQEVLFYRRGVNRDKEYISEIGVSCQEDGEQQDGYYQIQKNGYRIFYKKRRMIDLDIHRTNWYVEQIFMKTVRQSVYVEQQQEQQFYDNDILKAGWNRYSCYDQVESQQIVLYVKYGVLDLDRQMEYGSQFIKCESKLTDLEVVNRSRSFVVECPSNCKDNEQSDYSLYSEDRSICVKGVGEGWIGTRKEQKLRVNVLEIGQQGKKYYYLENVWGKKCKYNPRYTTNYRHSYSFIQMNEKVQVQTMEKDNLNMIPTELISKMANVMNQNTQNIIQQNLNIKEIQQENEHIEQKIKEMENGKNGLDELRSMLAMFRSQMQSFGMEINSVQNERQKMEDSYNQKMRQTQVQQQIDHQNRIDQYQYQETQYDLFNYQIIDSVNTKIPASKWQFVNFKKTNQKVLQQQQQFNYDLNSQDLLQIQSMILNKLKIESDYVFETSLYLDDFTIFSLIFNYKSSEDYWMLQVEDTYQMKQLKVIEVKQNGASKCWKQVMLCNFNSRMKIDNTDCIEMKFNRWYLVKVVQVNGSVHVQIGDQKVFIVDGVRDKKEVQVGFSTALGNGVYFTDIKVQAITINQYLIDIYNNPILKKNKQQPKQQQTINQQQQTINQQQETNSQQQTMNMEDIKKDCISGGGSNLSCTSAMIAYDQFVSNNPQLDPKLLENYIFTKCMKIKESSIVGCQLAQKKGVQLIGLKGIQNQI